MGGSARFALLCVSSTTDWPIRVSRSCSMRMLASWALTVVSWSPTLRSRWCRQPGSSGSDVSAPLYMCLGVLKSGGLGTCDEPCRRSESSWLPCENSPKERWLPDSEYSV